MNRQWDVAVIGAGGSQAQAMLAGAARAQSLDRWIAVDRAWTDKTAAVVDSLGMARHTLDLFDEPERLAALFAETRVVANLAGPYYRTGEVVLDAAIRAGANYLDICDDADAVLKLLTYDDAAQAAGVTALIGMGSSPGTTNVLIRAAVDELGSAENVDIYWTVDVSDSTPAAARHFWHCFNLVDADGAAHPVPTWDEIERVTVDFPEPVGPRELVRLAHPEPVTVPRYLPVDKSNNFGAVTPVDALQVCWAMAYATDPLRDRSGHDVADITDKAVDVFAAYRDSRPGSPRVGSGMVIDVHTAGTGLRFSSGAETEMAEATGVPAAAGLMLMLAGQVPGPGVLPPELLRPADFFASLQRVSRGGGGLQVHRLVDGKPTERMRIRDLFAATRADRRDVVDARA
ncbi:saccharopine dehydrogenase [Gordonia sp. TBRC 11910]|uniref:Saccharopine dehydrogenase n=1 Tax=Gordonia asplenii TaxID=2725283 RepID=A0A848L155_9ACTN|nr:saccharopine dehydrogenase NADP-binding domain-containing protein [Gordonia asplenii]NMO02241.1 saccharopine dehydrogenase [Gordonia asplenii]